MSTTFEAPYYLLDRDYGPYVPKFSQHSNYKPSLMGRLVSWQSRFLDLFALDVMEKAFLFGEVLDWTESLPKGLMGIHDLYAARELRESPESFYSNPPHPPNFQVRKLRDLVGGERIKLTFESTYDTFDERFSDEFGYHSANGRVSAVIWRHHDRDRPTVIGLHCWCGGYLRLEERIFAARTLYNKGYNVVVMAMPFHGPRTPTDALFSGQFFPSPDLRRTNEAFGQAVADVRLLTGWLRDEGHEGNIGLMGISLGGYTSALLASLTDDYSFVVPVIAPASFADILWWHGSDRSTRKEFETAGADLEFLRDVWGVHCPLSYKLQVPPERALIVAGAGDEVVRPAQTLALWKHWGEPELRWFSGSHLGSVRWLMGSFTGMGEHVDFMSPVVEWLAQLEH